MDISPSKERYRLFRANIEKIEFRFEQSSRDGVDRPVIFVFDIRDKTGRAMAVDIMGKEDVMKHQALAKESKTDHCVLCPMSLKDAVKVVSLWPSRGKSILNETLPREVFPVVIVGCGGITWARHRSPN